MRQAPLALATLFFLGCQTVEPRRDLAPGPAAPPLRVALAEPVLDLWVEGAGQVSPEESGQALQQSQAALGAALGGRTFVPQAEADHLLLVQVQGVTRTDGRRGQQTAAVVGIVLVLVAVVVLVAIASRGNSSSGRAPAVAGGAGAGRAAPRGVPVPGRGVYPGPRGFYGPPAPWFGWSFDVGFHYPVPVAGPPLRPPETLPTLEGRLPARGFFAGDETEVVLELRDARSGETVWSRRSASDADPRDAAALRALVDRMAWDQAWARPAAPAVAAR